jgi:hypothetical protein
MPVLSCYVSERAHSALLAASQALGRPVDQLAEAAIESAALAYESREPRRRLPDVPGFSRAGDAVGQVVAGLKVCKR